MKEFKVMFLCHGAGNGGAERVITTLASEFAKRDYVVMMVTTNEDNNDYVMHDKVIRERVISNASNAIFRSIDRIYKLRQCIKCFKPDCIISFSSIPNMQAIIARIGLKTKLIISERTDPRRYPTNALGRIIRSFLYPFTDRVVFQTKDAMNYFPRIIRKKSLIIVNPIAASLPEPFYGIRENRIIGIGSLGEQKNWSMALKACRIFFRKYPDYILEIFGEGPDKEKLQSIIDATDELKGRVFLKGFSTNVLDRLVQARMYISSSNYEGISNSMLEALAVGTPTICTDAPVGGARMFIKNGVNGFLVPVGDFNKLAKAMEELASDDALIELFSSKSIKIKDKLNISLIVDKWEKEMLLLCNLKGKRI